MDNCPLAANADQADDDGDGVGNVCEADADSDGIPDGADNCPDIANPDQEDLDGDGQGDVCDSDTDGDGIDDENARGQPLDNCPLAANPDQADTDGDGIGDECDLVNDAEYACDLGEQFSPMLTSDTDLAAEASKDRSDCLLSLGLLCDVDSPENVVDNDLANFATMLNGVDLLGLSAVRLRVATTTGFAYPGSNAVGIAFNESAQSLQTDLLGGQLIVRTLLDGAVQEESTATGALDLDLLGASGFLGGTDSSFLVFQTEQRFDSVEVEFAPSLLSLLNEVNIQAVCAAKEGL
ncbi:MAG: thrombospondin type 3 repeat-containing protein [Marinobacter sp.]|uniref:thrombospondin type 3 repeat-containing protein n=1 Tax=Marinobacter sp. TaxID=50741 RepID=UPI00396EDB3E